MPLTLKTNSEDIPVKHVPSVCVTDLLQGAKGGEANQWVMLGRLCNVRFVGWQ